MKKDLLPRGKVVEINNKPEITLLDDLLPNARDKEDSQTVKIMREDYGFAVDFYGCEQFRVRVNSVCFFLDQNCELVIGDPSNPEASLAVAYLDFPKLRVNFNGFRIRTHERNVNSSNHYMINEKNQNKNGLHLKDTTNEDNTEPTFILNEQNKCYYIGSEEGCKIKTQTGGKLGFIKFVDDIGWVVQAPQLNSKGSREEMAYGIYIKVRKGISKFKLYQGMTLLVGTHLVSVKALA